MKFILPVFSVEAFQKKKQLCEIRLKRVVNWWNTHCCICNIILMSFCNQWLKLYLCQIWSRMVLTQTYSLIDIFMLFIISFSSYYGDQIRSLSKPISQLYHLNIHHITYNIYMYVPGNFFRDLDMEIKE